MPTLTEDEIDEILYLSRANETKELTEYVSILCKSHSTSIANILEAAIDPASGNGALHFAAANGHFEILNTFLPAISASSSSTTPSSTPLFILNRPNAAGNTPLHWASLNGHLACVKVLLSYGTDPTLLNSAGHDAIFEAEMNGKTEVVDWLLENAGTGMEKGMGEAMEKEGVFGDEGDGEGMEVDRESGRMEVDEAGSSVGGGATAVHEAEEKRVEALREKLGGIQMDAQGKERG